MEERREHADNAPIPMNADVTCRRYWSRVPAEKANDADDLPSLMPYCDDQRPQRSRPLPSRQFDASILRSPDPPPLGGLMDRMSLPSLEATCPSTAQPSQTR
jgi:hypothetical protein